MRKGTILIVVLYSSSFALAQQEPTVAAAAGANKTQPARDWLGVFGGPHLNYLSYYDKTTTIEGKNVGIHAGGFYQKNIGGYFAIQPQLLFSIRGGKIHHIDSTVNTSLLTIELPVNFLFLYNQLMIGGGPNFCYGIRGQMKSNGVRNAYETNESFERTLKRFEFGGNFVIAYTLKNGMHLSLNFSPGFTSIYKGDGSAPPNLKANTTVFGISIGYTFAILAD
jgi:Outer membrane protein beta-barrel domain